jgi:hypothetical protein
MFVQRDRKKIDGWSFFFPDKYKNKNKKNKRGLKHPRAAKCE